jgi:hypothetical protein
MTQHDFLEAFDSKKRDFEMFTAAGNRKCQAITKRLIKKVFGSKRVSKEEIQDLAGKLIAKAYLNKKTSEILDSEPPYHIKHYLNQALKLAGYGFSFDSYSITDDVWKHVEEMRKEA